MAILFFVKTKILKIKIKKLCFFMHYAIMPYMETHKIPLAQKLRPTSLENFVGQEHIVGQNKMLSRAIEFKNVGSCIFYGPPGTGKTPLLTALSF